MGNLGGLAAQKNNEVLKDSALYHQHHSKHNTINSIYYILTINKTTLINIQCTSYTHIITYS